MAKKVVVDPDQRNKVVDYITSKPLNFYDAQKAVEVNQILREATMMDIQVVAPDPQATPNTPQS